MKILYFTPFYPPQSEAAATRAYWFVKVLKEEGHEVKVLNAAEFTLKLATNKDKSVVRLLKENLAGIELFLRIFLSRNDRIILSSPPFFTVIWGALAAILSRQNYLLDIRDLYPDIFFELGMVKENSPIGKLIKYLTKIIYNKASSVISVTKGVCAEIAKYGVKTELIMNGYDSEIFFPGKPEEKFARFTLVFHGNLGKVQNIDTLLKVAKELESEEIDIIVAGEGSKAQDIIAAKRKNIKFLGAIPYLEIPQLLRKCHVGLSFRTDDKIGKEAFPVKVFEYVGCGLPVIMSPTGEAGAIIQSYSLGIEFENRDIASMISSILRFKTSENSIVKVDEFSRQEQARKVLKII